MNRKEAEDFVYQSYVKAEKKQDYRSKDAEKRHPELTKALIAGKAGTPAITVTGSKGKGSVSNMISQILQSKMRVGLMTSPHLNDFCERFKINGQDITDEEFAEYMTRIEPEIRAIDDQIPEDVCVSPMGIQAYFALTYFNDKKTDFNIFEGGKGVKYDDVNNVEHEYGVINSIFLEHTRELGETLEAIAEDKAHIITGAQKCVYVAEQTEGVQKVIAQRAEENDVPLKVYGVDFRAENIRYSQGGMVFDVVIGTERFLDIQVPLLGEHQAKNCALAMALCRDILKEFNLESIREKLLQINWPGRMEVLSSDPFVMLDACINSASCKNVKKVIEHLKLSHVTVIVGIPDDKDYAGVVRSMAPASERIILTKSQNLHYVFTPMQKEKLQEEGIETTWTASIEEAISEAKKTGNPIIILGTTSVVSEVTGYFKG